MDRWIIQKRKPHRDLFANAKKKKIGIFWSGCCEVVATERQCIILQQNCVMHIAFLIWIPCLNLMMLCFQVFSAVSHNHHVWLKSDSNYIPYNIYISLMLTSPSPWTVHRISDTAGHPDDTFEKCQDIIYITHVSIEYKFLVNNYYRSFLCFSFLFS